MKTAEPVLAAGGNEPGHPFWGNQYTEAAGKAEEASTKAEQEHTTEAHSHAEDLHMAARNEAKAAGNLEKAKYHSKKAGQHQRKRVDVMVEKARIVKEGGQYKLKDPPLLYRSHDLWQFTQGIDKRIRDMEKSKPTKGTEGQEEEDVVQAAHGELTGKPGMNELKVQVDRALHVDPRFDTDSHGYPEGSPQDRMNEPFCVDILVPDDDGQMEAVVRTDEGKLMRVGFEWDGEKVLLSEDEPEETAVSMVYARAIEEHEAAVNAESSKESKQNIIHCRESGAEFAPSAKWSAEAPVEFMWMPGGVTTIHATWNGRPIALTVECDQQAAVAAQESYSAWLERYPKQEPFGCVEHREEEASVRLPKGVAAFEWRESSEPGIYLKAVATELGARNVNGRIHRSWSPSFLTNAEYHKARCSACRAEHSVCQCSGELVFPKGAIGASDRPARITGVAFSVGTLTNKPAFKNISPVRAKEGQSEDQNNLPVAAREAGSGKQADPLPVEPNAETQKGKTMKVMYVKARGEFKAGTEADLDPNHQDVTDGIAMPAAAARVVMAQEATIKASNQATIKSAVQRAVDRGAIAPKADGPVLAKANERLDAGAPLDLVVELIDGMQTTQPVQASGARLTQGGDGEGHRLEVTRISLRDATEGVVKAMEPQNNLIRGGTYASNWKEVSKLSTEAALILREHHMKILAKGDDFSLREAVKAATTSDPDSQVGSLAGDLILMRNLGYLKNKLNWMPYLTTDLSAEPAKFGQAILTRYITPPGVLTWVPGTGFTSDSTTISNASAGTTQAGATNTAGTVTKSVPSTTDKSVTMNMFKATEIEFAVSKLALTARALFAEQLGAQTYSLAENINQHVLTTLFSATWSGTIASYTKALANWSLIGMIGVKNAMSISKIPDVGRFILLHSTYYDKLLEDSNLLTAKAILALIKGDESAFAGGELPPLFGLKPLESQLASAVSGTLTAITDPTNLGSVNQTGFAGNQSSMLFVARPPQDWTTTLTQLGIPSTASIRIVTEPDSGLSVMVFSYADNGKMSISQRVCLMWGDAQGDPRVGVVIKPS